MPLIYYTLLYDCYAPSFVKKKQLYPFLKHLVKSNASVKRIQLRSTLLNTILLYKMSNDNQPLFNTIPKKKNIPLQSINIIQWGIQTCLTCQIQQC